MKAPRINRLVTLLAACFLFVPAARGQLAGRVSGMVVDASGGVIPRASVTLFSDDSIRAGTADQNGRFDFDNLPQGLMNLEVSSPGFKTRIMTNVQGGGFGPFEIVLQVGSCPQCLTVTTLCPTWTPTVPIAPPKVSYEDRVNDVNVAGKVRDPWGAPFAQAAVTLANHASGTGYVTIANDKGEFQFRDVEPGRYELKATRDNYSQRVAAAAFLVARKNLTRIDGIYLFPAEEYTKVCPAEIPLPLISPK